MAVYTDVPTEALASFLAGYDVGELLSYKGIAEGVENSNFLVHTSTGYFILTLYEKRVAVADVPFFLALMEHLHSRGITCPQPVKTRKGETLGTLCGRPAAIVTFLDGMWMRRPDASNCAAVGEALARAYGAPFCDADDLHTPAAVAKMARGEALTDEDRWPWIVRVREAAERAANPRCVVACSCLRRAYRDVLRATDMRVVFVYLLW